MRKSDAGRLGFTFGFILLSLNMLFLAVTHLENSVQKELHANRYREAWNGREPPNGFDGWVDFALRHNCETDTSAYKQIYKDLDPWFKAGGIDSKLLDELDRLWAGPSIWFKYGWFRGQFTTILNPIAHLFPSYESWRFIINKCDEPQLILTDDKDSNVTFYRDIDHVFQESSCFRKRFDTIQNNSSVISGNRTLRQHHGYLMHPDTHPSRNLMAPLFSQVKTDCFEDILLPMNDHIRIATNPPNDIISWNEKKPVLFWRGSSTGGSYRTRTPWRKYHRTQLMDWVLKYKNQHRKGSSLVDIGFNSYTQHDAETSTVLNQTYGMKPTVSYKEILKHKYLLVVDGNTWPARLQQYLQTNPVVLYAGIFTDFFNWQLIPWVHYIPVSLDFSNLEERLQWLLENEKKAEQISKNARKLMENVNRPETLQCYTSLLLLEYKNLLK